MNETLTISRTTKVLAATHLDQTEPVLEHALRLAEALDGEVVIVHALSIGSSDPASHFARAVAACESARRLGPRVSRTSVLRFGEAQGLVALSSEELSPAIVVMGAGSPPGPVARGVLRSCRSALWIARGTSRPSRIVSPIEDELVTALSAGLRIPVVATEEPRADDLLVIPVGGLSTLSRLQHVRSALREHGGPILISPA